MFGWLLPACTAAPEALAAPYTHDIGRAASAVGIYLAGLPAGTALGDLWVARVASARVQRRLVLPGALLTCLPLLLFLGKPGLAGAVALLFVAGLGNAYTPGYDQTLLSASDERLRGRTLALQTAGLMFSQGVGFAVWGLVAEFAAPRLVIPIAAICGLAAVALCRPRSAPAGKAGVVRACLRRLRPPAARTTVCGACRRLRRAPPSAASLGQQRSEVFERAIVGAFAASIKGAGRQLAHGEMKAHALAALALSRAGFVGAVTGAQIGLAGTAHGGSSPGVGVAAWGQTLSACGAGVAARTHRRQCLPRESIPAAP